MQWLGCAPHPPVTWPVTVKRRQLSLPGSLRPRAPRVPRLSCSTPSHSGTAGWRRSFRSLGSHRAAALFWPLSWQQDRDASGPLRFSSSAHPRAPPQFYLTLRGPIWASSSKARADDDGDRFPGLGSAGWKSLDAAQGPGYTPNPQSLQPSGYLASASACRAPCGVPLSAGCAPPSTGREATEPCEGAGGGGISYHQ